MVTAPCKDCPDRHLGCHGTCEKYQKYKAKQAEINEAAYKRNEAYNDLDSYREEKTRRLKH